MDHAHLHYQAMVVWSRFADIWEFDNFWIRGNTFDAALMFHRTFARVWPADPAMCSMQDVLTAMCARNRDYLQTHFQEDRWWSDDFGWWGIAALNARSYLLSTGDSGLAHEYLTLARRCWEEMIRRGYDHSDAARPVAHGIRNAPKAGQDGTKNTVTNANFLVLCLRLYRVLRHSETDMAEKVLGMAYMQYRWFSGWFSSGTGYLQLTAAGGGLVHERPMAPPDYQERDRPPWQPGWVWTGDQGLVLAALQELLDLRHDVQRWAREHGDDGFEPHAFEHELRGWIRVIVDGVGSLLCGLASADTDRVLREPPFNSAYIEDPTDYVCGRGVLLRFGMESLVQAGAPWFAGVTESTTRALWASRDPETAQVGPRWNPQGDLRFNHEFVTTWGAGDGDAVWQFATPWTPQHQGIFQAMALDVLGAAIGCQPVRSPG